MFNSLAKESVVDGVEVVTEERILLDKFLVRAPLFKSVSDVLMADLKHSFSISATSLLEAPGGRVVEVKIAWQILGTVRPLLEVVAHVETRVSFSLLPKAVCAVVVVTDGLCVFKVSNSMLVNGRLGWDRRGSADCYIDDNVGGIVHDLQALLNSDVKINVPDSATIHVDVAIERKSWEDEGDRSRGHARLG